MDAAAVADPAELIAASGIHQNGIGEWPKKLQWPVVLYCIDDVKM